MLQIKIEGDVWWQRSRNGRCASAGNAVGTNLLVSSGIHDGPTSRSSLARKVAARLVVPRIFVVDVLFWIEAGKKPVFRQFESVLDNECGVRVVGQILLGNTVVLQRVVDDAAQEGNVRTGANLQEKVSLRRRAGEPGIDDDDLSVAVPLRLHRPLESTGMVFGWIPAHDQHHVGVLDVDPAIGHRPASESWSQT